MKVYQEKLFRKLQHLFKSQGIFERARDDFHDSMRSKVLYEGLRLGMEVGISGANKSYVAIPQDRIRGTCHIYGKGGKGGWHGQGGIVPNQSLESSNRSDIEGSSTDKGLK
jgi:hypothetical protein